MVNRLSREGYYIAVFFQEDPRYAVCSCLIYFSGVNILYDVRAGYDKVY